ncbi:MAG: potassium-transporting ATPase subunit KdpA [Ignavibacteria bacterium]
MQLNEIIQIFLYVLLVIILAPPLGKFMYKVFQGEKNFLTPVFGGIEKLFYKLLRVDPKEEMDWKSYLWAVIIFKLMGLVILFLLQVTQQWLPLNPQNLPNVSWHLAFNTASSFITNTNWQNYGGENTLSYFTQMMGLGVQNFVSAATGFAVLLALIRALVQRQGKTLGNFWVDMVRSTLYVLLPMSIILAVILVSQGVVQTFSPYITIKSIQGYDQIIPLGPAASQIAIKQLGTNGGGFFNVNSAFPFENPTPLSNFLEMFALVLIPAALVYTYGKMIGSLKQARAIFAAMLIIFLIGLGVSLASEYSNNPVLHTSHNMEGKEMRFGVANSVLWSVATTVTSNGSVNAMHDSLTPLSGMVCMINIQLGEIIFGGIGSGLYGMIIFILLTVFISGLMVGRTPEYLGKKIEAFDVKMAIIAVLLPSAGILIFSAIAVSLNAGLAGLNNSGPHGLSEILYAYSSTAGNNGSAFAGLNANTVFYNLTLAANMLIGRFGVIIPVMAIAGNLVKKNIAPASSGTFATDSPLFVALLIGVILIVGALTFFPALNLGPIVEHILMKQGVSF